MIDKIKNKTYKLLRKSEKYTKTDMVYLTKGGFWLTLGQIISSTSAFLLAIAFANLLPKETYGQYKYILSILGILSIFTLGGMGTAIVQAVARGYEGSLSSALKIKIRWGLLSSLASLSLAGYYYFNDNTTLTFSFLIASIFLPFFDTLSVYNALLQGKKLFKVSSKFEITSKIIATITMITAVFFSKNIIIILTTYLVSYTLLRLIFLYITFKKHVENNNEDPSTISYGKHLSLMCVIGTIAAQIDKILVFHYLGATQVAIYSISIAIPEQIKGIYKNINSLAFSKFTNKTIKEIKKTIYKKIIKLSLFSFTIAILYILLAQYIYQIFFPKYIDYIFYTQILSISIIFFPAGLITTALQAQKAKIELYKFNIYSPIIQIVVIIISIYFYGLIGIIISRIITRIINFIILIILFNKFKPIDS